MVDYEIPYGLMPYGMLAEPGRFNIFVNDPDAPDTIRQPQPTLENHVLGGKAPGVMLRPVQDACVRMGARVNLSKSRILVRVPHGSINCYNTGSVVCTGAKSVERAVYSLNVLLLALRRYNPDNYQPSHVRLALDLQRSFGSAAAAAAASAAPHVVHEEVATAPMHVDFGDADDGGDEPAYAVATPQRVDDDDDGPPPEEPIASGATEVTPKPGLFKSLALNNIVACVRTGLVQDLNILREHVVKDGSLETDNFPGLIRHVWVKRPGAKDGRGKLAMLYFTSGSFNVTGAQTLEEVWFFTYLGCADCWQSYLIAQQQNTVRRQLDLLQQNGIVAKDTTLSSVLLNGNGEATGAGGAGTPTTPTGSRTTRRVRPVAWAEDADPYAVAKNLTDLQDKFRALTTSSSSAPSSPAASPSHSLSHMAHPFVNMNGSAASSAASSRSPRSNATSGTASPSLSNSGSTKRVMVIDGTIQPKTSPSKRMLSTSTSTVAVSSSTKDTSADVMAAGFRRLAQSSSAMPSRSSSTPHMLPPRSDSTRGGSTNK